MPSVLIGANVVGKPNFMTAAFCGVVNGKPPMISTEEKFGPMAKIGGALRVVTITDGGIHEAAGHQIFDDGIPELTLYPEPRV